MSETVELVETDAKGRPNIDSMSDHDMLVEIVSTMRYVADALESLGNSKMGKMFGMNLGSMLG